MTDPPEQPSGQQPGEQPPEDRLPVPPPEAQQARQGPPPEPTIPLPEAAQAPAPQEQAPQEQAPQAQWPPAPYVPPGAVGAYGPPLGRQRGTGISMVLFVVTLGIYGYVWIYQVHEEMKRHTNDGLGGGIGLLLWFFLGTFAMGFLTPMEVGRLYERRGQQPPVTALTGLWATVGILLCGVGPIVWFVQTNNAINDYWRSLGVPDP